MSFGIAARLRAATFFCIDTIVRLTPKGTLRPDSVMVVRLDAIGDFVLWLDAARAVLEHYESIGKSAVLVANAVWAAWARDLTAFKYIIALDVKRFQDSSIYRYRMGREIRSLGCAVAVNPTYSRDWSLDDSVIRICGAKERIGSSGDSAKQETWQRRMANRWYTRLLPANPVPRMELQRNAEFMRNLGELNFVARLPQLSKSKTHDPDNPFASAIGGRPYYVLFPGASWSGRQWPALSFVKVAEELYRHFGWEGVVCGGAADHALADRLCQLSSAPLLNWAGRTTLAQLAAILSVARLLLTGETSAVHIATGCNVPTVCILGGGHYGRFLPYQIDEPTDRLPPVSVTYKMACFGCNWQCIYPRTENNPVPCIEQISVEEVWAAISGVLKIARMERHPGERL